MNFLKKLFTHRKKELKLCDLINLIDGIAKLEKSGLIAINYTTAHIHISSDIYDLCMCDSRGCFDSTKACDFINKVRLYINFIRASQGNKDTLTKQDRITFSVESESKKSIILIGKYENETTTINISN